MPNATSPRRCVNIISKHHPSDPRVSSRRCLVDSLTCEVSQLLLENNRGNLLRKPIVRALR